MDQSQKNEVKELWNHGLLLERYYYGSRQAIVKFNELESRALHHLERSIGYLKYLIRMTQKDYLLIKNKFFFEHDDFNGNNKRTKQRLIQIENMGLVEVGEAQFGIPGIMSGLYIEKIWSLDEDEWRDYVDFINDLKKRKQ